MATSFNFIPQSLRLPLFWAEVDSSRAGVFSDYRRAVIFGYKRTAGTGTAGTLVRIGSLDQARVIGGAGSHLADVAAGWFANNAFDEVWAMPIAEPAAGVAATGTILVAGPATASGTISLYIGGRKITVAVLSGDAATAIAAAIAAAVNAATDLVVTATAATATVTLTAKWKGIDGNYVDIRHSYRGALGGEALPAGVTLTITAMASGSGVPDLTAALANLGDQEFDTFVVPWTDTATLDALDTFLHHEGDSGRWAWAKQLYGHAYTAIDGTPGTLQTFGAARNGAHVTCFGYRGSPTPCWQRAAMYAANAHRSAINDPARPFHTLELIGMLPATPDLRYTKGEQNALAYDGISCAVETADGKCLIATSFTMYQKNKFGQDDDAFLKVQTLNTLSYILRSLRYRIQQRFPRHKLGNDDTRYGPGQAIATPATIKAVIVGHYREMEYLGIVENADAFVANLIVERNAQNPNRVDVLYPPDLVNQLDVFAVLAQYRLQYPDKLPDRALAIS